MEKDLSIGSEVIINGRTYTVQRSTGCCGCAFFRLGRGCEIEPKKLGLGECYTEEDGCVNYILKDMENSIKPFSIEMVKKGRKVRTRNGYPVRILATDLSNEEYPVVAAYLRPEGKEEVTVYTPEGRLLKNEPSGLDLFICAEEMAAWVNVYLSKKGDLRPYFSDGFSTLSEALENIYRDSEHWDYVDTINVKWKI